MESSGAARAVVDWRMDAAICVVIALITLIPYAQTFKFDFVNFDDPAYVYEHSLVKNGVNWKSLLDATIGFHQANWHPLVWYSYMLEVEAFGMNPGVMHTTNVVLHIMNSLLLYFWLRLATRDYFRCCLAAILFAIHPAHVESVAWITERKDVLSTLFLFLTLVCYTKYAQGGRRTWYAAALVAFATGLTAKAMLVTVPVLLPLIEIWPLQNRKWDGSITSVISILKQRALAIIPFAVLSAGVCVITVAAQKSAGAISDLAVLSLDQRLANSAVSFARYSLMTVWPSDLSIFYAMPSGGWHGGIVGLAVLFLAGVTSYCLAIRRTRPSAIVGWLWFLVTLLPVIGLVQVGIQAMADRYTYVPMVGLSVLVLWCLPDACFRFEKIRMAAILASIVILMGLTVRQVGYWENSITLLTHSLDVAPDQNLIAYHNLPLAYNKAGEYEKSVAVLQRAVTIFKTDSGLWFKLGNAMRGLKQDTDALECYRRAIEYDPKNNEAYNNLGLMLSRTDNAEGMKYIRKAIELNPLNAHAHNSLGNALVRAGELNAAQASYLQAIKLADLKEAKDNLQYVHELLEEASGR
jgi:protein O-mannosyl-transferase